MSNPNKLTHAQLTDPGFKTFLVAQNKMPETGIELDADTVADRASEQAWDSSLTLASALGKERKERFHGKAGKHGSGVITHDPYRTYREHAASVKTSDAPAPELRLNQGVFHPLEVANIEAAEKSALLG